MLRKIIKYFLLVLLCLCIVGAFFAYTRISDATWLASQVQKMTTKHAGIDVDIKDGVRLEFLPHPTLVLGNVHIHRIDGGLSAFIKKIKVIPILDSILEGELSIKMVEIIHPILEIDTSTWKENKEGIKIITEDTHANTPQLEHLRLVSTLKSAIQYIFIDKLSSIILRDADIRITSPDATYIHAQGFNFTMDIDGQEAELSLDIAQGQVLNGAFGAVYLDDFALQIPHVALKEGGDFPKDDNNTHIDAHDIQYLFGECAINIASISCYDAENSSKIANARMQGLYIHFKDTFLLDDAIYAKLILKSSLAYIDGRIQDSIDELKVLQYFGMGDISIPNLSLVTGFASQFSYDFEEETLSIDDGLFTLQGAVDVNDYARQIRLRLPFTWDTDKVLTLRDAAIGLDGNALQISATCHNLLQGKPIVKGHVDLQSLSLTQLFGFARRLPNGLQHALNDITGQLDFELDTEKVVATRIDAVVCGLDLTGTAHIADLSYPDLVIDISGPYLDANKVLPEINNQRPDAPVFAMEPIIAAPHKEKSPHDKSAHAEAKDKGGHFGYDIRVHAKDVDVYVLALHDLDFRCIPSENGTLLTFDSPNMYGGLVDLELDITDAYELEGNIKDISLAEPLTLLAGWPAVSGTAQLVVDIKAPFRRTLKTVLDGLTGSLNLRADNGVILVDKSPETKPFPYKEASFLAHIEKEGEKTSDTPENYLSYDGTWNGHWVFPNGELGRYDLDGVVHFDFNSILPVACTEVPARIHAFFPESESAIPGGISTDFTALISSRLDARWLDFTKMQGTSREINYTGRAKLEGIGSAMRWSGFFSMEHANMRKLLESINCTLWDTKDTKAFGLIKGRSQFNYAGGVLSLHQAQFYLDESRYGGNLRLVDTRGSNIRPLVYFDMTVDSFDANKYLPAKLEDAHDLKKKVDEEKLWDLSKWFLCDVDGYLNFGEFFLSKQRFTHVFAPIEIENGLFTMDELDASLHDGKVTLGVRIDVDKQGETAQASENTKEKTQEYKGLHAECVVNGRDLNVQALAATITDKDYLGGVLDGAMGVHGDFACNADLTRALDGEWFLAIKDGYLSQTGQGELRDKRIAFSSATASGLINKGLVENKDLKMRSLLIDMSGEGWLNLSTETVDYSVDVAFAKVPSIPIKITGTWNKPDLSINGVGIVTGTLVNIGTGVFDILGSVLMAPFDFFSLIGLGPKSDDSDVHDNGSIGPHSDGLQGSEAFVPFLRLPPME